MYQLPACVQSPWFFCSITDQTQGASSILPLCGHEGLCGEKLNSLGCRDELQALFKNHKTDLDHVLPLIYIIPINILAQNISFPKYSHRLIMMIQYLFPVFPTVSL
ncbi:hypothetical protein CHARACLAT_029410 [Characodon lateralis]|uniref:Uncharacterized protein n=1 Tax=Characodon lateralis TaxID=208331 RepID=A0ABU7DB17_9TELE|nr:hypothetical protein [Characodon lateralis]